MTRADDEEPTRSHWVRRRSTWVAWALLAAWTASVAALLATSVANGTFAPDAFTDSVPLLLAFAAFMVVGALIVAHRPGNAIGWIFSAIALLATTGALGDEYATYATVTRPGSLPAPLPAAWWASWTWYPTLALTLAFTPLLFPTGRPPTPRWRPVAWLAGVATAAFTLLAAFQPTLHVGHQVVANPIGVAAVENPERSVLGAVLLAMVVLAAMLSIASLVVRFRRSRGEERAQLKWFTYAGLLLLPMIVVGDYLPEWIGNLSTAMTVFLPIAAGVAILRYRLYEIDRLINRTLVYGLLTVLLAGVYAGLVLVLGQLFGDLGDRPPSWVVAGATLAVAALFQPARRRVQRLVDRRFNRARYDAARTVEGFSARLRDQVELDALSAELLAVVDQTVQPTRASLWLRS
jgi:hypothetical protein